MFYYQRLEFGKLNRRRRCGIPVMKIRQVQNQSHLGKTRRWKRHNDGIPVGLFRTRVICRRTDRIKFLTIKIISRSAAVAGKFEGIKDGRIETVDFDRIRAITLTFHVIGLIRRPGRGKPLEPCEGSRIDKRIHKLIRPERPSSGKIDYSARRTDIDNAVNNLRPGFIDSRHRTAGANQEKNDDYGDSRRSMSIHRLIIEDP